MTSLRFPGDYLKYPLDYKTSQINLARTVGSFQGTFAKDKLKPEVTLSKEDVITQQAQESLQAIKDNTPGCGHTYAKITANLMYYPVVGTALGTALYGSLHTLPFIGQAVINSVSNMSLTSTVVGTAGACVVLPRLGAKIATYVTSLELVNGRKAVSKYFDTRAAKMEASNAKSLEFVVANTKAVWNGQADALFNDFTEVKNDPIKLKALMAKARLLNDNMPNVVKLFKENRIVEEGHINDILCKFKTVLKEILDEKFVLRSSSDNQDVAFNIQMLLKFPVRPEKCIPQKAQQYIAAVKANELCTHHEERQWANSNFYGFCAALPPAGAMGLAILSTCDFYYPIAISGALATFGISQLVTSKVSSDYETERKASVQNIENAGKAADEEMAKVYTNLDQFLTQTMTSLRDFKHSKLEGLSKEQNIIDLLNNLTQKLPSKLREMDEFVSIEFEENGIVAPKTAEAYQKLMGTLFEMQKLVPSDTKSTTETGTEIEIEIGPEANEITNSFDYSPKKTKSFDNKLNTKPQLEITF